LLARLESVRAVALMILWLRRRGARVFVPCRPCMWRLCVLRRGSMVFLTLRLVTIGRVFFTRGSYRMRLRAGMILSRGSRRMREDRRSFGVWLGWCRITRSPVSV
jgi:hypothetical protein